MVSTYHASCSQQGVGYLGLDTSNHQMLQAADVYLRDRQGSGSFSQVLIRGAVDAALIFETEEELDESLFWIIGRLAQAPPPRFPGNSHLRVVVVSPDDRTTLEQALQRLAHMRPVPR